MIQLKRVLRWWLGSVITALCMGHAANAAEDQYYNFSWLDPEKKVYVLQNRRFEKAKHVQLSLLGGSGLGETYRNAYQVQPRLGYWWNEDFGFEVFYTQRFNSLNNAYKALVRAAGSTTNTTPYIREINGQIGFLLNWAPWYAKINVFNSILFFDWYFSLGGGMMFTEFGPQTKAEFPSSWQAQNIFAVYAGTGHLFHLSERFDFRLDFLGHFYSADVYGGFPGAPVENALFSQFSVSAGLGVKF